MVMIPPRRRKGEKKPAHKVEQLGSEPFFRVTSGNSGTLYKVVPDNEHPAGALCPCEGFRNRQTCSHIDAVRAFVAAQKSTT